MKLQKQQELLQRLEQGQLMITSLYDKKQKKIRPDIQQFFEYLLLNSSDSLFSILSDIAVNCRVQVPTEEVRQNTQRHNSEIKQRQGVFGQQFEQMHHMLINQYSNSQTVNTVEQTKEVIAPESQQVSADIIVTQPVQDLPNLLDF